MLTVSGAFADGKPRQRIGLGGVVCKATYGLPKWGAGPNKDNNGERGDVILLYVNSRPRERITVGAYLFYRKVRNADGIWEDVTEWSPTPVTRLGASWGYKSESLGGVGNWVRFTNSTNDVVQKNIQLFVPFAVIGLAQGEYRFRYRIRVWVNGHLEDDFFTDENRLSTVGAASEIRELISICKGPGGLDMCEFRLLGTNDEHEIP